MSDRSLTVQATRRKPDELARAKDEVLIDFLQCNASSRAARADVRRQQILDTARTLFARQGFHRTGVAQIAAESGVAVGQLYRDFASKEDMIAAIVSRDMQQFLHEAELDAAIARADPAAARKWLGRIIADDEPVEECCLVCEVIAESGRNPRIAEVHQAVESRLRGNILRALAVLLPGIDAADSRLAEMTDLVQLLSAGLVTRRLTQPERDMRTMEAAVARILDAELARLGAAAVG